ncbi:MAG: HAMP domain-containing histidine kinase [Phycisphaeraceae bacterium]|nr:HAMP domain-containing histidine kinase [Phycisphaerales bacterium]MCB9861470.1 HAMP domain-containing histidine kinase [Phycisphaeraceae bacterium]
MNGHEHDNFDHAGQPGNIDELPEPAFAPATADRVTELAHEINNMLDGSMRCLMLARRALDEAKQEVTQPSPLEQAHQHINTAVSSLEQMGKLVHERMMALAPINVQQASSDENDPSAVRPSVAHVVRHACELVMPKALECGAEVVYEIDDACKDLDSGPLYPVVLNGVLNAIEAIGLFKQPGRVTVLARCIEAGAQGSVVRIEVLDNGPGLPVGVPVKMLFDHGYSTKPALKDGTPIGIGLSLSKQIITQAGGTIELRNRTDVDRGAALVFVVPVRTGVVGGDVSVG